MAFEKENELNKDILTIHDLKPNNALRIYKKEGLLQADFYQGKEKVATSKKIWKKVDCIQANSSTIYYINEMDALC